jgi:FtsP/CotA-like multicopper oxidase with cupredoxin domain
MACRVWFLIAAAALLCQTSAVAQTKTREVCPRPAPGSDVPEPKDLRSQNGVLKVDLIYRRSVDSHGLVRYCYLDRDGSEAPTLRVNPGDLLVLNLQNSVTTHPPSSVALPPESMEHGPEMHGACTSGKMTSESTNLHFHGLTVPPVCHQDDVLKTMIQPGDPPFEYKFRIPANEPPGLYWYHPHVHGLTTGQVLGGASGALIVQGIERANTDLAGLPERVFIIRDQELLNPNATPAGTDSVQLPPVILDHDGDALNTGTGTGKPAKDLSLNFVPVPYPDYPPAVVAMKPGERQLWRVLNASAITYLNLEVVFSGSAQQLGVVAIDGIPTNENGVAGNNVLWQNHLGVPPGGRIEFIVKGPPQGTKANFVTRSVNTGWAGENDPNRPLATIVARADAPEPVSKLTTSPTPLPRPTTAWIGNVPPIRVRKLYFSETLQDPQDPNSPTTYFITEEGHTPKVFDPNSDVPDIVVHQGDVEDWIIENRTQEVHAFHIHQIHFMLLSWFGLPVNDPFLRDTVNVPFWDGKTSVYPMVKLRMDFRDPNSIGTFVYHCHVLEHEDGGMMGLIRVNPPNKVTAGTTPRNNRVPHAVKLCGFPGKTALAMSLAKQKPGS